MALSRKEAEDLKPNISDAVKKSLGFTDETVVMAAIHSLTKNHDKKKTIGKLFSPGGIQVARCWI